MSETINRRQVLKLAGGSVLGCGLGCRRSSAPEESGVTNADAGRVIGVPMADEVGEQVLASGGNAVDAIVAAALTAAVVAPQSCGIAGYGGHMTIATADGATVTSIDFNSTAPASFHDRIFPLATDGSVRGRVNLHGWLAAGVPGTLAGMQLALESYGTRSFAGSIAPAIRFARDGFEVSEGLANSIRGAAGQLQSDPASQRLFFRDGRPLAAGDRYRNPELAEMLEVLAEADSVEPFYRGRIATRIAAAFAGNGGAVTEADLAAHHARQVQPVELEWRGYSIRTAPLTAGGTTPIEALGILKALEWNAWEDNRRKTHALLEALRIGWHDRLTYFGDPEQAGVPLQRLLSGAYAGESAERVRKAVEAGAPLPVETDYRSQDGTIHLSAVDGAGNMVALTMTHGAGFGARVTVGGLGLILGHGMSRFDPRPGRANSPGPGKRPLHNMCPTIVLRDGRPVMAVGGRGGRKIPNAVFQVLLRYTGEDLSMEEAVDSPRLHTEGGMNVTLDSKWNPDAVIALQELGYETAEGSVATVSAVSRDPATGRSAAVMG